MIPLPQDTPTAAKALSAGQPALMVRARQLAATLVWGTHGRRRAGLGESFWQYRPAQTGDAASAVDWRRSGRSDDEFIQEKEWQVAQSLQLWVDPSLSMTYASGSETKRDVAQVLALALADAALRAGESVGTTGLGVPAKPGNLQFDRMAAYLTAADDAKGEFAAPDPTGLRRGSQAVLLSDFMGDIAGVEAFLATAAKHSVEGALIMVLDPAELEFPFRGRSLFQSMGGALEYETQKAASLKDQYQAALAQRQDVLTRMATTAGWHMHVHVTDKSARDALIWACGMLGPV